MNPAAVLAVSAALIAFFAMVELRDARFRASWSSDRTRLWRNLGFLVANIATMAVLNAVSHALTAHVPRFIEWRSTPAELTCCFLLAELVNWVSHYAKHRHPWLWTFHTQHHVEEHYSINLTLHTHGLEVVFTGAVMVALLTLAGFSRFAVDVFSLVYFGTNLYKHCSWRASLGPLDYLIVSPAYHRLHHAKDHDGNFGSVLTVFDVLFRTATFPSSPEATNDAFARKLGVTEAAPFGFVAEITLPFRR
ncbi:MAG TPA: sterol desaturase family protein [Myxococcota bacterium]|jgi:sterol desaturase/sphingolipid hydroxylase (fatty acid hydroxylase superfamily)